MLNINHELVQDRLLPALEALQQDIELLEPADVLTLFNEYGLVIVESEVLLD